MISTMGLPPCKLSLSEVLLRARTRGVPEKEPEKMKTDIKCVPEGGVEHRERPKM